MGGLHEAYNFYCDWLHLRRDFVYITTKVLLTLGHTAHTINIIILVEPPCVFYNMK